MMNEELELVERWILTFAEAPVVLDAELMPRLIAEERARQELRHGKVVRRVTSETRTKGHKVAASHDNPEYIVESDKTGARGAQAGGTAQGLTGERRNRR